MKAERFRHLYVSELSILKWGLLIALWTASFYHSVANTEIDDILIKHGFENIRTATEEDTLYAAFENSTHRASYRGIGVAIEKLSETAPNISIFKILVLEYCVPRISVVAQKAEKKWSVTVSYETVEIQNNLQRLTPQNTTKASTFGKIDLTLHPIISIDNHLLDKLAEVGIFIAPAIETTLWKGSRITFQPILPLYTNLFKNNPDRLPQLGVMAIRQDWVSNRKWTLSTTIGSFLYNIMGLHLDATYHLNDRLDFGVRSGWAAEQVFKRSGWKTGHLNKITCMINANYYEPYTSLQIKASAGRFLYGDYGFRGDLVRHFGEVAIGVYGIYTDGEKNAGFNFAIPLGARKQHRKGRIRLYLPQYFSWEYSMISYYRYAFEKMGREYKEFPDKNFTTHYWQPTYIQQYLQRYLNGYIR